MPSSATVRKLFRVQNLLSEEEDALISGQRIAVRVFSRQCAFPYHNTLNSFHHIRIPDGRWPAGRTGKNGLPQGRCLQSVFRQNKGDAKSRAKDELRQRAPCRPKHLKRTTAQARFPSRQRGAPISKPRTDSREPVRRPQVRQVVRVLKDAE